MNECFQTFDWYCIFEDYPKEEVQIITCQSTPISLTHSHYKCEVFSLKVESKYQVKTAVSHHCLSASALCI